MSKQKYKIFALLAVMVIILSIVGVKLPSMLKKESGSEKTPEQIEQSGQDEPDDGQTLKEPVDFKVGECDTTSIKLGWSEVKNADGYEIGVKRSGKYKTVGNVEGNEYTLDKLLSAQTYDLCLRAYSGEGDDRVYGDYVYLSACTLPEPVHITGSTPGSYSITVNWQEQDTLGYQIQYSESADFVTFKEQSTEDKNVTEYRIEDLKPEKEYYIRVRSYTAIGFEEYCSEWQSISVSTKKEYETTSKGYKIEQKNGFTYVDGLLIANKTYSVPSTFDPGGLTSECSNAFADMRAAAAKDGVNLYIVSGYRSYSTQNRLYNNYVAKDGKAKADTYSARPGTSEHQTGLAMDLNSLQTSFGQTKEGKWLAANSYKYGFIIRYPEGKQEITGYIYEPWHVRYVGVERATKIYESGLCLEEYYGITSKYDE